MFGKSGGFSGMSDLATISTIKSFVRGAESQELFVQIIKCSLARVDLHNIFQSFSGKPKRIPKDPISSVKLFSNTNPTSPNPLYTIENTTRPVLGYSSCSAQICNCPE